MVREKATVCINIRYVTRHQSEPSQTVLKKRSIGMRASSFVCPALASARPSTWHVAGCCITLMQYIYHIIIVFEAGR